MEEIVKIVRIILKGYRGAVNYWDGKQIYLQLVSKLV